MTRATGVGGVFLRAADPEKLHAWYEEHLGIKRTEDGAFAFFSEGPREMTVLAFFPLDTKYFGPSEQQAMLNLRVDDLDASAGKTACSGRRHRSQAGGLRLRPLRLVQRSGGQPSGTVAAPSPAAERGCKNDESCVRRSFCICQTVNTCESAEMGDSLGVTALKLCIRARLVGAAPWRHHRKPRGLWPLSENSRLT